MSKESIGTVPCLYCGRPAEVRRMQSRKREGAAPSGKGGQVGKLYVYCPNTAEGPGCGAVQAPGASAQAAIIARAEFVEGEAPAAATPGPVPVRAAAPARPAAATPQPARPAPAAPAPEKPRGIFDW